jgi:L-amino acid N-acyltransferase YncA
MLAGADIYVKANVMSELVINKMRPSDWEQVQAIYLEGIATGQATFETEAPSWEVWDASHLCLARLVARERRTVLGWAALSPVSNRRAYAGVAEVSVYVARDRRGAGIGRELLEMLITESEKNSIWTLQAVMFPENQSSLALHRRCGFRKVGRRERIGRLNGVWQDTMLLERRSQLIGID